MSRCSDPRAHTTTNIVRAVRNHSYFDPAPYEFPCKIVAQTWIAPALSYPTSNTKENASLLFLNKFVRSLGKNPKKKKNSLVLGCEGGRMVATGRSLQLPTDIIAPCSLYENLC